MDAIIDTDPSLDDLPLVKLLAERKSPFLPKIKEVYEQVKDVLNHRVQHVFPNYTLHNVGHSYRIIKYMGDLVNNIQELNDLEVALLVYSALLHDIGMAVSEDDIQLIKSDSFQHCDIKFSAMLKLVQGDESLALQEYVRRIHASLSARYIMENLEGLLTIPNLTSLSFAKELALICQSHNEDFDWIKKNLRSNQFIGDHQVNTQFTACILRLADILDIDSNRTPYNLFRLIAPKGVSAEEWQQHFLVYNNNKIIFNEKTNQKKVVFQGKSTNASIHRKLLEYIGWVKDELVNVVAVVSSMPLKYNLFYDTTPEVLIQTEGYTFSDYKMTLQFKAISSLLMGEKIYGAKSLGLRELIQNSMDACRTRQENEYVTHEFGYDVYYPKIKVILNQKKNQTIIKDNGAGMSLDIIKKHFLNVGVSYYDSRDFLLKDLKYKPIGNFGIGFLSCFMLSDEVTVITRHHHSKNKYKIELEKGNEYTSLTEEEDVAFEGTEVILNYKQFIAVFENDIKKVREFLEDYFLIDGIEIQLLSAVPEISQMIVKPPRLKPNEQKGLIKIDFNSYLNEVEGYALIRPKNSFIKAFQEINFNSGEIFIYKDESGIKELNESIQLNIDDFINNEELKYLSIPIVEEKIQENYLSGMRFTNGDVDEVIRKMEKDLRWITVILRKEDQEFLIDDEIESGHQIFGNFSFDDLVSLGHCPSCKTQSFVREINLFEGFKNNLYLPFKKTDKSDFFKYHFYTSSKQKELYIRNVLIKDFVFDIPVIASLFDIVVIEVNVTSRKIIPDISRNNVDIETTKALNYAFGKAIHEGAGGLIQLNQEEKVTLDHFIRAFYSSKTNFDRRPNIDKSKKLSQ